jgi:hypothetical protein
MSKMKEMNAIYENYPKSPDEFISFKNKVKENIEDAKARFRPNPV